MNAYAELSDEELIQATRNGDSASYAALWLRHAEDGLNHARTFTKDFDPEDLVAESYLRILSAIQGGKGPTVDFRPYLVATIRNTARTWGRKNLEIPVDVTENDGGHTIFDDQMLEFDEEAPETRLANRILMKNAFESLTPVERQVLWASEVEGLTPSELGTKLGLTPNAASGATFRARESLRQAWIQAHLRDHKRSPECTWTIARLGAFSRGKHRKRDHQKILQHLETCPSCPSILREAKNVATNLNSFLIPLTVVSGASAAALLAGKPLASAAGAISASSGGTTASAVSAPSFIAPVLGGLAVIAIAVTPFLLPQQETPPPSQPEAAGSTPSPKPQTPTRASAPNGTDADAESNTVDNAETMLLLPAQPPFLPPTLTQNSLLLPMLFPDAPTFNFVNGTSFHVAAPVLSGQALPNALVTLIVSGSETARTTPTIYSTTANAAGGWKVQLKELQNSSYSAHAYQIDHGNLRSNLASTQFSIDSTTVVPLPSIRAVDTENGIYSPIVTGTGEPGYRVTVMINGIPHKTSVSELGEWRIVTSEGILPGTNILTAIQRNRASRAESQPTPEQEFILSVPGVSQSTGAQTLTFEVSSLPGSGVEILIGPRSLSHHLRQSTGQDLITVKSGNLGFDPLLPFSTTVRYLSGDGSRVGAKHTVRIDPL
ncbi:sigma-70 family RNA polymerase sigma factor [Lysinibacter sp. HNR]|uniref:RNA polymerase sigma factor n=1 Tax=Lysinibacter sp. HNR TaxID=3031408 RepID=UPI002435D354|nr:sigma-70 family RNA polymerase sigma factor [Lysinibacter sp. HNR]WGD37736.1 sigma-70 family RNA polymerase sigma factor [Lysinibacter sp. HNR]